MTVVKYELRGIIKRVKQHWASSKDTINNSE